MMFEDLDTQMRIFETASDRRVPPGLFLVVRLDGRSFTRLTKETFAFEAPFDVRFRDLMSATTEGLMGCGPNVVYGYAQSDEISLLLAANDDSFGRKLRKLISVLAGEASARMSLLLGKPAVFDARVSELPSAELVGRYFTWRQDDAARNALNGQCYWVLRKEGQTARQATQALLGQSVAAKNDLLFARGINFAELPTWQRRGVGLYWESYAKAALDPRSGAPVLAERRRVRTELSLPMRDQYRAWVLAKLADRADGAGESNAAALGAGSGHSAE